jgi:hypothetical protein
VVFLLGEGKNGRNSARTSSLKEETERITVRMRGRRGKRKIKEMMKKEKLQNRGSYERQKRNCRAGEENVPFHFSGEEKKEAGQEETGRCPSYLQSLSLSPSLTSSLPPTLPLSSIPPSLFLHFLIPSSFIRLHPSLPPTFSPFFWRRLLKSPTISPNRIRSNPSLLPLFKERRLRWDKFDGFLQEGGEESEKEEKHPPSLLSLFASTSHASE